MIKADKDYFTGQIDVLTVQEDNYFSKSDPELIDRAFLLRRALFTYDDDLLVEAAIRQRSGKEFMV